MVKKIRFRCKEIQRLRNNKLGQAGGAGGGGLNFSLKGRQLRRRQFYNSPVLNLILPLQVAPGICQLISISPPSESWTSAKI